MPEAKLAPSTSWVQAEESAANASIYNLLLSKWGWKDKAAVGKGHRLSGFLSGKGLLCLTRGKFCKFCTFLRRLPSGKGTVRDHVSFIHLFDHHEYQYLRNCATYWLQPYVIDAYWRVRLQSTRIITLPPLTLELLLFALRTASIQHQGRYLLLLASRNRRSTVRASQNDFLQATHVYSAL